jgi:excisionase family DNA binding protein
MDDTILTSSGAARLLGCSVPTVLALAKRGELAVTRIGAGLHLFVRTDVERLAAVRAKRRQK